MRLTLLRAKEAVKGRSPADKLEYRLNRANERLLLEDVTMLRVALIARYGQLTLPRRLRTVEGIKMCDRTLEIANQWYEFMPGQFDRTAFSMDLLRDIGDGHAIIYDLPAGGTLESRRPGIDAPVMTVSGVDATGLPLVDTWAGAESKANPFVDIARVHKETTATYMSLVHVADDLTETTLALMEPTEEETYYRRYKIDSIASEAETPVIALCKVRHIEFTSDSDILPVTNLSALELAMDTLQYEAQNDLSLAEEYWQRAVRILEKELADTSAAGSYPVIRMVYPGRTAPKFTCPR